jgi:murein DD-endopeptidase MepM/ murein hydrolase activator NlpD
VRARNVVSALLLVSALAASALAPAAADDISDKQDKIDDQISQTQEDLEGASKALEAAAADLAQSRVQLPGARAAYDAAMGKLATARDQLELIRQRLRELRAQQQKVEVEIEQAQQRIAYSQVLIARIVRYQYQSGGFAELQMILESESPTEFIQRLVATQSVTDSQSAVIDQLTADEAVLAAREQQMQVTADAIEAAKIEAQEQVDRLRTLAQEAKDAKAKIKALISMRTKALAVAEEQRQAEKQRLADLKDAQAELAAQAAAASSSGAGLPNGELNSPIPGAPMVQGVGWRTHPVYGYLSCHTGIDLSASSGTPIRAARGGVVIWTKADLSGPYGNNTLVDHGDGLSTFYAHQSAFNVSPGQRVHTGQVIGYVGTTGYSTGPHLHFEVHINGVPYDPMAWFDGSPMRSQSEFCP